MEARLRRWNGTGRRERARAGLAAVATLAAFAGCAGASRARPLAPLAAPAVEVSPGSASVAWSPDGGALAVVQPGGVIVLDLARGETRAVSGPGATAVDWAPAPSLLVVERDARGARAVEIAPDGARRRVLHEDPALVAARWLHGGAGFTAVAQTSEARGYGTELTLALTVSAGAAPAERYRSSATLTKREPPADLGAGWREARPSAADHALLLPVFRKAPLFPARVELVSVDPFDPQPAPFAQLDGVGRGAVACASPDGSRAAVAGEDGRLRVVARGAAGAAGATPAAAVSGLHPSWHPAADVIFLGGALVDPAGGPLRELVADGRAAIGAWSPAGDRLAVAADGRLYVFATPGLGALPEEVRRRRAAASAALWELGALRAEGLVAPSVYQERRARLRARAEER